MNVIDLFSGGGGLTEGFLDEGYKIVAHVEKDKWACETIKTRIIFHYLKARKDLNLYNEYLLLNDEYKKIDENREIIFKKYPELKEQLEIEVLNDTFGNPSYEDGVTGIDEIIKKIEYSMKRKNIKNIDIIIGGPPCQAYSLVGRGVMKDKAESDRRNFLFRYYKDIVNHFRPSMFIFENVPGILTAKKGDIFKAIVEEFNDIGFNLFSGRDENPKKNIINTQDLGLPQTRKRVILFGYREDHHFEYPDFFKESYTFSDITTRGAIGDLPKIKHNQDIYSRLKLYVNEETLNDYQKLMRMNSIGVMDHSSRKHHERDLRIYKLAIKKASHGESLKYTDIPIVDRTHKNQKAFLDRFKVHWWEKIPHTILAHLSKDGHYNIHPDIDQCRSLTVREAARIQTFPDNYKFEGPRTAQFTQVGNAVPPLFSKIIAKSLKDIKEKQNN